MRCHLFLSQRPGKAGHIDQRRVCLSAWLCIQTGCRLHFVYAINRSARAAAGHLIVLPRALACLAGAFGTVYRARLDHVQPVAVKMLKPDFLKDKEQAEKDKIIHAFVTRGTCTGMLEGWHVRL